MSGSVGLKGFSVLFSFKNQFTLSENVSRGSNVLTLEFFTEISLDMFHSLQQADLNFPPVQCVEPKMVMIQICR